MVELSCGMKCVKYMLLIFNLVFFIAGLGLIIAGAVVQAKFNTYFDFFGGTFNATAILLIVVGVFIFIIAGFGCFGAWKENYCMVMTFAVLLFIIFIMEISAGIAAYAMRGQVEATLKTKLVEAQKNYGNSGADGVSKAWDAAQKQFKCCGVNNYTDWRGQGMLNATAGDAPDSCCKTITDMCGKGQLITPTGIYTTGCIDSFEDWVHDNIFIIGGVGIGLAFVQVFGIIFACCLARSIKASPKYEA